jgi:AcrR family transcriptional regulator
VLLQAAGPEFRDTARLDWTGRPVQHRLVVALAADPTIRRQVMRAAREVLADDPDAPIARITTAAGVSRATLYRHFGSRAELLASIDHEAPPPAADRILQAAQGMLVRTSLDDLSMDQLALAAGVSRGTLYRLFPGKPALLRGLVDAFSPFEAIRAIVRERGDEGPEVVFPLVSEAVLGVAGERLGLMRAIFHEATLATADAIAGVRPVFEATIGILAEYVAGQMAAGRIRRMHPVVALQAFVGPIFFHLMTRPVLDEVVGLPMTPAEAVDVLTQTSLAGLHP